MRRSLETVAVVGGGPAGSSAALTLASAGVPTVLIHKADAGAPKIGESLPPSTRTVLESLGVWDRFLADPHREAYANRSAWGTSEPEERHFLFDPYGPGWHLDRARFDRMLLAAAQEAGAAVRPAQGVRAVRTGTGRWQLGVAGAAGRDPLGADVVVDGTGRASWLSRQQGARRRSYDRLVGMVAWLESSSASTAPESVTLVEATEHGWWYSAPVPAPVARLVAVYFTDADLLSTEARREPGWWSLLARAEGTAHRARSLRLVAGPRIASAASSLLEPVAGDGWIAVGDAAMTFDPLSSQGIAHALASGQSAGRAVLQHLGGDPAGIDDYAASARRTYARYLAERAGYYALERRWPWSTFWRRRIPVPRTQGGTHERHLRLLCHPPRHRPGQGREQPVRVLPRP